MRLTFLLGLILICFVSCKKNKLNECEVSQMYMEFISEMNFSSYKLRGDTLLFRENIAKGEFELYFKILNKDDKVLLKKIIERINPYLKDSFCFQNKHGHNTLEFGMLLDLSNSSDCFTHFTFNEIYSMDGVIDSLHLLINADSKRIKSPIKYINCMSIQNNLDSQDESNYNFYKFKDDAFTIWSALMFKDRFNEIKHLGFDVNSKEVKKYDVGYVLFSELGKRYDVDKLYHYKNSVYIVFNSGVIHQYNDVYID